MLHLKEAILILTAVFPNSIPSIIDSIYRIDSIVVLILLSERRVKARCGLPDGGIAAGFFQH